MNRNDMPSSACSWCSRRMISTRASGVSAEVGSSSTISEGRTAMGARDADALLGPGAERAGALAQHGGVQPDQGQQFGQPGRGGFWQCLQQDGAHRPARVQLVERVLEHDAHPSPAARASRKGRRW